MASFLFVQKKMVLNINAKEKCERFQVKGIFLLLLIPDFYIGIKGNQEISMAKIFFH